MQKVGTCDAPRYLIFRTAQVAFGTSMNGAEVLRLLLWFPGQGITEEPPSLGNVVLHVTEIMSN